ncbi:MAG: branched-chain amino acid ABC transporter ATP-binding protein/permease [Proteobacteria bacterium]|nr:MAG: branched-chain amino acid ABC transporter ATP-binding protein/permease [Pseudomonadota bacterium]
MSSQTLKRLKPLLYVLLLIPMLIPFGEMNDYYVHGLFCRILVYTIFVASLDIVVGYIGDISIGHAGLFAFGAYSVAILTGPPIMNTEGSLTFLPQIPFLLALIIGIVLAALAGLVLGFPSLRASGPYLAVTTIAFGMIINTILTEQEHLTNATKGIHVGPISVGDFAFTGNRFVWIAYPSMLLVMWIMHNFGRSFWGRAFEAIKFSSIAAEASGIKRNYFKIAAFVISAAIAGFAGGLYAQLDQYVAPGTFSMDFSVLALMALIFGGLRSNLGNFVGMALVVILPDAVPAFADYRLTAFGILLLLALFFLPTGIAGLLKSIWYKIFGAPDHTGMRLELDAEAAKHSGLPFKKYATEGAADVLTLTQATMRFGGLTAVNALDLKIKPGSIHGLMGPNGSGKSTTVNIITGVYIPTSGSVQIFGKDARKMKTYTRAINGVGRTFQNLQLFGDMTVLDNVMVGLHLSFKSPLWKVMMGLPSVWREEHALRVRAYRLLQFVNMSHLAFVKANSLAYGQARRLEIARALACDPALLLLDEPAAGLTGGEIGEFNEIIRKIKREGVSILLIEHHMDMLMEVSEEITVLDFGKKIAAGTPAVVQANPAVVKAYLGTDAVTPAAAEAAGAPATVATATKPPDGTGSGTGSGSSSGSTGGL